MGVIGLSVTKTTSMSCFSNVWEEERSAEGRVDVVGGGDGMTKFRAFSKKFQIYLAVEWWSE